MKSAFSFIEVIISVVILSYLGVAILNFNSFNKKAMFKNIKKQNTLLLTSPILTLKDKIDNAKVYKLNNLVTFKNLSDEDRNFLKGIEIKAKKRLKDKLFLYNDGKKDFFVEYGSFSISYKENDPLLFMYIERP